MFRRLAAATAVAVGADAVARPGVARGLLVPVSAVERALLIATVLLVIIVELLNSSVEAAIDRISFDLHSLSRRAKDLGSAAVLVALLLTVIVWGVILTPVLLSRT